MVVWEMSQVRLKGLKSAKEMTGKDMQKGNALRGHKDIQTTCLKIPKKTPVQTPENIPQTLNYLFMFRKSLHLWILGVPLWPLCLIYPLFDFVTPVPEVETRYSRSMERSMPPNWPSGWTKRWVIPRKSKHQTLPIGRIGNPLYGSS